MKFTYLYACLLIISAQQSVCQGIKLANPIQGNYLTDYYIVNYVDNDTAVNSVSDFKCRQKTYDGHTGTDYVLRSFAQMDSGVKVLAAADGKVIGVVDNLFDRSKNTNSNGFGNYIAIAHDKKYFTYYAHNKKNSALVQVGDSVKSGEAIASVGSSGNSADPQLHFEIWYDTLYAFDPYSGPCHNYPSFWYNELGYDSIFRPIEHGMLNFIPTIDTLRERPKSLATFFQTDAAISFWNLCTGIKKGDSLITEWYTPQGALYFRFPYYCASNYNYFYYYTYINVPKTGGTYSYKFLKNSQKISEENFVVSSQNSIELLEQHSAISIYNDENILRINSIETTANQLYQIIDCNGKLIKQDVLSNQIPISDLSSGVYILSVHQSNKVTHIKFIK